MDSNLNKNLVPVFYDPTKRRWKAFLLTTLCLTVIVSLGLYIFLSNLIDVESTVSSVNTTNQPTILNRDAENKEIFEANKDELLQYIKINAFDNQESIYTFENHNYQRMAFYINWDPKAYLSLKDNLEYIDVLVPEWLQLSETVGEFTLINKNHQLEVKEYISTTKPGTKIVPLITSYNTQTGGWNEETVSKILQDTLAKDQLVNNLYNYVKSNEFEGIVINFGEIRQVDEKYYQAFLAQLSTKFHESDLKTYTILPLNSATLNYKSISDVVDKVILTTYNESWPGSQAGPVASYKWFTSSIAKRFSEINNKKIYIALANLGYDWSAINTTARSLSFQEVMNTLRETRSNIVFSPTSLNPTFTYIDEASIKHTVWYLDSITAYNQIVFGSRFNPNGFALWRLGSEDPQIWEILKNPYSINQEKLKSLEIIDSGMGIDNKGEGEIFRIEQSPNTGKRTITYDAETGLIYNQEITEYSSPYVLKRYGNVSDQKIALTFDDGPDPKNTPKILDILKAENVKATFFIVGGRAEFNPELIRRIYNEGHEIGNHTFTHPNLKRVSDKQTLLEVNTTQKLLASILGKETLLFRPPFGVDSNPSTAEDVASLEYINGLGFYTVGMQIDPNDWEEGVASEDIESRVYDLLNTTSGNVVLLHDGGGNRSQTIEALPNVIKFLKDNNYEMTTISGIMGVSRDEIMPVASNDTRQGLELDFTVFTLIRLLGNGLSIILLFGVTFGVTRLIVMIIMAIFQKRKFLKTKANHNADFKPKVAILVPAYNEAAVITKTIDSILETEYDNFEIVAVDDGSDDGTYEILVKHYSDNDKVKIFTKERGGKSRALNFAMLQTDAELIAVIDADTILHKSAIAAMAARFIDPEIGAVAGNVKVGNRNTIFTKLQALEYIVSQNLEKRFLELLNCITVVPGAIGMWKKDIIINVGGFCSRTLAEDAELTLAVLKVKKKVVYEESAIGYTEVPKHVNSFLRQRFRWMFGIIQTFTKHIDLCFNIKYGYLGMFAVPFNTFFQIFLALLAPLVDLYVLFVFAFSFIQLSFHPEIAQGKVEFLLTFYLYFLLIDLVISLIALLLEGKENYRLLLYLPFQRIVFRILYYIVAVRVLFTIIKGPHVKWHKLLRTAEVEANVGNQTL